MNETLEVLVETGDAESGELLIMSPGVGMFGHAPAAGQVLVGRSRVGRLTTLERSVELVTPRKFAGRVAECLPPNRKDPVEYGQLLLRLVPVDASSAGSLGVIGKGGDAASDDLPEGQFAVVSPTHGMFYRRPSPDSPCYVEEGQVVEEGTTLALVEVMKCFSAIAYGGEGLPPRAKVVEIRCGDGTEVKADQVLLVVEAV